MLLVNDSDTRFGLISVVLHWYVALAVLTLLSSGFVIYFIGEHGVLRPFRDDIAYFHMSIAMTSIPFFLFRIFWRVRNGMPETHNLRGAMKLAADWVWRLLLFFIVWQITVGLLVESNHWFEIIFGRIRIPQFVEEQASYLENLHQFGALAIATLLVLHIGGALKHHFIDKDRLLRNMVRPVAEEGVPAE